MEHDEKKLRVSMIVDFYYLELLSHLASTGHAHNWKAAEKLVTSLEFQKDQLSKKLARCLRDYLYEICIQEAGYASYHCEQALDKPPNRTVHEPKSALLALIGQFEDEGWADDGYGGESWAKIARCALEYDKLDFITFVDHVADVEHNGGELFDKFGEADNVGLRLDMEKSELEGWLEFKAHNDILGGGEYAEYLSTKTKELVNRYFNIFRGGTGMPSEFKVNEDDKEGWTGWEPRDIGTKEFVAKWSQARYRCDNCGEMTADSYEVSNGKSGCDDCVKFCPENKHYVWEGNFDWNNHMCEDCYINSHTECDNCGDMHHNDDITEVDGELLCPSCAKEKEQEDETA